MSRIHHIRRLLRVLAGLVAALVAVAGAPAAFAATGTYPPPGPVSRYEPVAHTQAAVTGGMAGWQIVLIAVGAAIVGAIVAVLLDRARVARRRQPATAA
jgi:uncharacterized membrane protein